MSHNLAARDKDARDRINVDLAAAGVAYKERLNLPVILPTGRKALRLTGFYDN